jgi:type VI secretion system protein VasG
MSEISRVALFGKLNPLLYKAVEGATVFCKLRGNPYVEVVHWLQQVLQSQDSDLHHILRHFSVDGSKLAADVVAALDRLPRGASSISDLSEYIEASIERAWVYSTLLFGDSQVRSGYVLVGMLKTHSLRNLLYGISKQFEHVKLEMLVEQFAQITAKSPEEGQSATDGSGGDSALISRKKPLPGLWIP